MVSPTLLGLKLKMDIGNRHKVKFFNESRTKKTSIALGLLMLLLLLRLWHLQILQGRKFRAFSDKNTIKEQKIRAPRGYFLDRNGQVLVGNTPGYRLTLDPKLFRFSKKKRTEEVFEQLAEVLGQNKDDLLANAKKNYSLLGSYLPTLVDREINRDQTLKFKRLKQDYPEINVEEVIFRNYPLKKSGAQIFGYVAIANKQQISKLRSRSVNIDLGDQIGQTGLEHSLDKFVRGKNGLSYVQVDARGRRQNKSKSLINYIGLTDIDAKLGNNVILTIDRELQKAAYEAFLRNDKHGERKGGLVALNLKGEVLAWASNPSYDPTDFQTGISTNVWQKLNKDPYKPLIDKVAQGTYSPGSVFKPFIGLAALHHKTIKRHTLINSPGRIYYGGRYYHDSHVKGHGDVNITQALEVSGNVFFYKLGIELGVDKMTDFISKIGFGSRTGVKYIQESSGLLPTTQWKKENRSEKWHKGENLSYSIGQGYILTTLLQLSTGYLALATKGLVYEPILVKEVLNEEGRSIASYDATLKTDLKKSLGVSKEHFQTIIDGLTRVTHGSRGTARYRSSKKFKMAGKTGTVQVRSFSSTEIYKKCIDRDEKNRHHGFFVGFAPAKNPEIVVAGLALHTCSGSSGAAPMVTDLLTSYMKQKHPELFKLKKDS